jgi:hypothetical protein
MCQFKSFIVTKTDVLHDLDEDSHEALIKKYGLKDNTPLPLFVRVEMTPNDGSLFNHSRDNWVFRVDQDYRPGWFSEKEAEEACWPKLQEHFKLRFLMTGILAEIKEGRWFIGGDARINKLSGSAIVGEMRETSQVGVMRETSRVGVMRETSRVGEMRETSQVGEMWETSRVGVMWGTSQVGEMRETSLISDLRSKTATWSAKDKAIVIDRTGPSAVIYTADSAAKLKKAKSQEKP